MKSFRQYWTFVSIRGAVTLVAALFILLAPQLLAHIFHTVDVGIALTCLATYTVFDASAIVLLAILLPSQATHRAAFYLQAVFAVSCGAALYLAASGHLGHRGPLWILASYAAVASLTECQVSRDTHRQYGCLSCYATPLVLAAAAISLPFASGLNDTGLSIVLATYVALYGTSELVTGGGMLFLEFRSEHPAHTASTAWRHAMDTPALTSPPLFFSPGSTTCSDCPAGQICHDNTASGHIARIMADRCPPIVRVARIATLLTAPATRGSV